MYLYPSFTPLICSYTTSNGSDNYTFLYNSRIKFYNKTLAMVYFIFK